MAQRADPLDITGITVVFELGEHYWTVRMNYSMGHDGGMSPDTATIVGCVDMTTGESLEDERWRRGLSGMNATVFRAATEVALRRGIVALARHLQLTDETEHEPSDTVHAD